MAFIDEHRSRLWVEPIWLFTMDLVDLKDAIAANVVGTVWLGFLAQNASSLLSASPRSMWPAVKAMPRSVYDQPAGADVSAQLDRILDDATEGLPPVAERFEAARADTLAFTTCPKDIWARIWSNIPQEMLIREIRSRTESVGMFPNHDSIIRLGGAVLGEQTDECAGGRRYFGLDALARSRIRPVPTIDSELVANNFISPGA